MTSSIFIEKKIDNNWFNFHYYRKAITFFIFICLFGFFIIDYRTTLVWIALVGTFGFILYNIHSRTYYIRKKSCWLFFVVSFFYSCYAFFCHELIINYLNYDYFIALDSSTFFNGAKDISTYDLKDTLVYTFSNFQYSESPLMFWIYGLLLKLSDTLNIRDSYLVLKLFTSIIGAFTIGITYIASNINRNISLRPFIWFVLFSAIFDNSIILLRDIEVTAIYIWCFYYSILSSKNDKLIVLKILLLASLCSLIRLESGLFCLMFIVFLFYRKFHTFPNLNKFILLILFFIVCLVSIPFIESLFKATLNVYQEMTLNNTSDSSFGKALLRLPFPLNIFFTASFSQILPFPFNFDLSRDFGGFLTIYSIFTPIYWLYIWLVILFCLISNSTFIYNNYKDLFLGLLLALLFILMICYIQSSVRRLMPVYPIIFIFYISFNNLLKKKFKKQLAFLSFFILFLLNTVYFIIK